MLSKYDRHHVPLWFGFLLVSDGFFFGLVVFAEDVVDEAVGFGFVGVEVFVAFLVFGDAVDGLAGELGEEIGEGFLGFEDFLGLDGDVFGLAPDAAEGLVDHDFGVGEGVAFAFGACGEDHSAAGHGLADDEGLDFAGEEFHGVVHGERVIDGAAGGVDVEHDVLVFLDALEVEEAHDDVVGGSVVDFADEEDDAVFEEHLVDGHFAGALVVGVARGDGVVGGHAGEEVGEHAADGFDLVGRAGGVGDAGLGGENELALGIVERHCVSS
jgi:hypothetical protein